MDVKTRGYLSIQNTELVQTAALFRELDAGSVLVHFQEPDRAANAALRLKLEFLLSDCKLCLHCFEQSDQVFCHQSAW